MEHETKASSSGGRHGSHKHKKKKICYIGINYNNFYFISYRYRNLGI